MQVGTQQVARPLTRQAWIGARACTGAVRGGVRQLLAQVANEVPAGIDVGSVKARLGSAVRTHAGLHGAACEWAPQSRALFVQDALLLGFG